MKTAFLQLDVKYKNCGDFPVVTKYRYSIVCHLLCSKGHMSRDRVNCRYFAVLVVVRL